LPEDKLLFRGAYAASESLERRRKGTVEHEIKGFISASSRSVVWIADGVSLGQHALMQDSRNQNTTEPLAVEYDVPAMLMTAQAGANLVIESA
jgi:hypothetical protein